MATEQHWTFESSTGKLYTPGGMFFSTGYAGGNCGRNPEGINNPSLQNVHNVGPLPEGIYTFGAWIDNHPRLGRDVFALIPDTENNMFGRGDFYVHGDTPQPRHASEGCIVLLNSVRKLLYASPVHRLQVVAVYQR